MKPDAEGETFPVGQIEHTFVRAFALAARRTRWEPTVENLFAVCGLAFVVVFALLALLALIMHLITESFPAPEEKTDPVVVAAIAGAVSTLCSGARVVNIEENR